MIFFASLGQMPGICWKNFASSLSIASLSSPLGS